MKKLFFVVAAMAALLTACSNDVAIIGTNKTKVSFTINSPELTTRYFGDGAKAKNLYYAVYDAVEGGLVTGLSKINTPDNISVGEKKEVTMYLVEGRTYDIIFYAESDNSPYKLDWTKQTLEVANPAALKSNMEDYDAFYAHVDKLTVGKNQINEDVFLKRPFAQLNILTNDIALGSAAGIDITKTSVTVSEVYTKMNLFTDKIDTASEAAVTFAMNKAPMTEAVVNGIKYHCLSMNYLLVNAKKTVDVTFTMQDRDYATGDGKLVRSYPSIFVERNHRTNIYGSIITNPAKFNVEILPGFEDPYNYDADQK